ncbi:MAG TPA: DUF222 domain-containing protein, partial [Jiangellaceae bacterium]
MSAATPPPYPPGPGTPDEPGTPGEPGVPDESAVPPPPPPPDPGTPGEPGRPGEPGVGGAAGAPVAVPEELAAIPPGAVLAGLLEDLDVETVSGRDTVEVLCAEYRQLCRQTARFYRAVLETGLRTPFSISTVQRLRAPGEFAAEEARAALVWSRSRAERAFGFAQDIFCRLPVLGAAMLAGELDEPRARAFIDWTTGLTDAQAGTVCDQLVPEAAGLMVGELIDRIKRACLAVDPHWAEHRYREAVRTRRVAGSRNPDGTANLGGYNQPIDRIAAACDRIDTLARACKHAGDRRTIDLIRSDLFLGMTDGTYQAMTENEIITHVLAHPYTEPTDHDNNSSADGEPGDGKPGDGRGNGKPGGGPPPDGGPGDGRGGSDDGEPGGKSSESVPGDGAPGDTAGDGPGPGAPDDAGGGPGGRPAGDGPSEGAPSSGTYVQPAGDGSGAAASAAGRS